jgi:hypothetical protein
MHLLNQFLRVDNEIALTWSVLTSSLWMSVLRCPLRKKYCTISLYSIRSIQIFTTYLRVHLDCRSKTILRTRRYRQIFSLDAYDWFRNWFGFEDAIRLFTIVSPENDMHEVRGFLVALKMPPEWKGYGLAKLWSCALKSSFSNTHSDESGNLIDWTGPPFRLFQELNDPRFRERWIDFNEQIEKHELQVELTRFTAQEDGLRYPCNHRKETSGSRHGKTRGKQEMRAEQEMQAETIGPILSFFLSRSRIVLHYLVGYHPSNRQTSKSRRS